MNPQSIFSQTLIVGLTTFISAGPAVAGVKLITLPARERVEIQLDNLHAARPRAGAA